MEGRRRANLANPERAHLRKKAIHLKAVFGMTLADYDALLERQAGGCAICGTPKSKNGRKLAVDHCHETGRIRGLLCNRCNYGIGQFHDRPDFLLRAAEYVQT